MLAHRGYHAGGVSENSLGAFEAAHRLGVDQLELDVRRTRDGELVIHHDPKLADGRKLAEVDYRDLPLLPDGQRIPTLAQVAQFARTSGARLAVELKEEGYEREVGTIGHDAVHAQPQQLAHAQRIVDGPGHHAEAALVRIGDELVVDHPVLDADVVGACLHRGVERRMPVEGIHEPARGAVEGRVAQPLG